MVATAHRQAEGLCKDRTGCNACRMYIDTENGTPTKNDVPPVLAAIALTAHSWMAKEPTDALQNYFDSCASGDINADHRRTLSA